jgi:ribosomal protein S18 acetylase RimI-like enzyme
MNANRDTAGIGKRSGEGVGIVDAATAADFSAARALFEEYAAELKIDLCFQGFAAELTQLEERYGPPAGCLLLARRGASSVGCGALRRLSADTCEMKRLYVRAGARGAAIGRLIAEGLAARARSLGYQRMVLDTLAAMIPARSLYRSLGFRETAAYSQNPSPDALYMELDLRVD